MASISCRHVKKVYPGNVVAVPDFSLEIADKEFIVFVGPSGCGKSTTLRMIAGLEEISGGEMYIGDRLINDVPPKDRDIAMVFQNYALYPHMTVYKNMAYGSHPVQRRAHCRYDPPAYSGGVLMRPADTWVDYELIDATNHNRLERWGKTLLIRPDPQIIWKNEEVSPLWARADAIYYRSAKGGGQWDYHKKLPQKWNIKWQDLTLIVSPTGFKHTGVFPEQAVNWAWYQEKIKAADRPVKVLNLFGYTGGATLACLAAGASVTHVDASKGMVAWARENAQASSLADRPCRWIVDDCAKFVQREIRRGSRYDAVIMDPPSYGRGPNGEIWKLEDNVYDLITLTEQVLSDKPLFFAINSYTEGLSPAVMEYVLKTTLCPKVGGHTSCDEIGLPVTATGGVVPCGATAVWEE